MRAAHRTEMGELCAFLRQGFIMELSCLVRIETEVELIFPAKLKACFGKGIVA